MIAKSMRPAIVVLVMLAMAVVAVEANAACCGGGTTAFHPSSYSAGYAGSYSANYPAAYQTYYAGTGWYPGYYWDRVRTRLWGSPTTYVAAYPSTAYYASSVPSYSVSYAPAVATTVAAPAACSSCSTCSSCTAGYSPCSSCGVQTVTMRPVCTTACASPCSTCTSGCSTCSTCTTNVVTQTSFEQPTCPTCNGHSTVVETPQNASSPSPDPAPTQTFGPNTSNSGSGATAPGLGAGDNPPMQREEQKPPTNDVEAQPGPGDDTNETPPAEDPYKVENTGDASTMFEAPKLHDPNDRTANRAIAPVKTALYKQPVAYRNVSTRRVTAEQARQDAMGWSSVSK